MGAQGVSNSGNGKVYGNGLIGRMMQRRDARIFLRKAGIGVAKGRRGAKSERKAGFLDNWAAKRLAQRAASVYDVQIEGEVKKAGEGKGFSEEQMKELGRMGLGIGYLRSKGIGDRAILAVYGEKLKEMGPGLYRAMKGEGKVSLAEEKAFVNWLRKDLGNIGKIIGGAKARRNEKVVEGFVDKMTTELNQEGNTANRFLKKLEQLGVKGMKLEKVQLGAGQEEAEAVQTEKKETEVKTEAKKVFSEEEKLDAYAKEVVGLLDEYEQVKSGKLTEGKDRETVLQQLESDMRHKLQVEGNSKNIRGVENIINKVNMLFVDDKFKEEFSKEMKEIKEKFNQVIAAKKKEEREKNKVGFLGRLFGRRESVEKKAVSGGIGDKKDAGTKIINIREEYIQEDIDDDYEEEGEGESVEIKEVKEAKTVWDQFSNVLEAYMGDSSWSEEASNEVKTSLNGLMEELEKRGIDGYEVMRMVMEEEGKKGKR